MCIWPKPLKSTSNSVPRTVLFCSLHRILAMAFTMFSAVVIAFAIELTQANQCTNGGGDGCTVDNVTQNAVSMLQTKLQTAPTPDGDYVLMPKDSRCQEGFGIQSTSECKSASESLGLSSEYLEGNYDYLPSGCNRIEPSGVDRRRMTRWNTAASIKRNPDSKPICKTKATVSCLEKQVFVCSDPVWNRGGDLPANRWSTLAGCQGSCLAVEGYDRFTWWPRRGNCKCCKSGDSSVKEVTWSAFSGPLNCQ